MLALLRKDVRLNAVPIVGGVILIAMPYAIVLSVLATQTRPLRRFEIPDGLQAASFMGVALTVAVAAITGGVAFALERRERSADFLAMLPVSRGRIVVSKIVVGLSVPIFLWLANFLICRVAIGRVTAGQTAFNHAELYVGFSYAAAVMLGAFAAGWYLSSFLSSPAVAAGIAIGIAAAFAVSPELLANPYLNILGNAPSDGIIFTIFLSIILVPAVGVFIAGTRHYLRRVEP